jgi:hypothetical protein
VMTVFRILLCAQCVAQTVDEKLTGRPALPPGSQQGHGSGRRLAEWLLLVSPIPSQAVTLMIRSIAHLLDPALADVANPLAGYPPMRNRWKIDSTCLSASTHTATSVAWSLPTPTRRARRC